MLPVEQVRWVCGPRRCWWVPGRVTGVYEASGAYDPGPTPLTRAGAVGETLLIDYRFHQPTRVALRVQVDASGLLAFRRGCTPRQE